METDCLPFRRCRSKDCLHCQAVRRFRIAEQVAPALYGKSVYFRTLTLPRSTDGLRVQLARLNDAFLKLIRR